ncbi:MAG: hypothetical protein ACKV2T_10820 [Kofleriaceae bacterium]
MSKLKLLTVVLAVGLVNCGGKTGGGTTMPEGRRAAAPMKKAAKVQGKVKKGKKKVTHVVAIPKAKKGQPSPKPIRVAVRDDGSYDLDVYYGYSWVIAYEADGRKVGVASFKTKGPKPSYTFNLTSNTTIVNNTFDLGFYDEGAGFYFMVDHAPWEYYDTDGDGQVDALDDDDDNDGTADDADGDDDGDGWDDGDADFDADNDGDLDLFDGDDDNDGTPDEQDEDDDGDGTSDAQDDDDDYDDADDDGVADDFDQDDDNDGTPDDQDQDDDGDGMADNQEDGGADDGGGAGDGDADNDGTPDTQDNDDDNDGTPDTQDNDDNNDGTPDPDQGGGGDGDDN